jgi:hypothetical protein
MVSTLELKAAEYQSKLTVWLKEHNLTQEWSMDDGSTIIREDNIPFPPDPTLPQIPIPPDLPAGLGCYQFAVPLGWYMKVWLIIGAEQENISRINEAYVYQWDGYTRLDHYSIAYYNQNDTNVKGSKFFGTWATYGGMWGVSKYGGFPLCARWNKSTDGKLVTLYNGFDKETPTATFPEARTFWAFSQDPNLIVNMNSPF